MKLKTKKTEHAGERSKKKHRNEANYFTVKAVHCTSHL